MAFEVRYRPQGAQAGARARAVLARRPFGERTDGAGFDKLEPGGGVAGADLLPHLNSPEDVKKVGAPLVGTAGKAGAVGNRSLSVLRDAG